MAQNVKGYIEPWITTGRNHLITFYLLLDRLEKNIGGTRTLAACSDRMGWPSVASISSANPASTHGNRRRAAYRPCGHPRIEGSYAQNTLESVNHKGTVKTGAGNHRSSIFRLIVGTALICRHGHECLSWGRKNASEAAVKQDEIALECEVSRIIGNMPFIWLAIGDEAGPKSLRGFIEKKSIALLSNYDKRPLDPPSPEWLGLHCHSERLRDGGDGCRALDAIRVIQTLNPYFRTYAERATACKRSCAVRGDQEACRKPKRAAAQHRWAGSARRHKSDSTR
jgi:hypothetical protein